MIVCTFEPFNITFDLSKNNLLIRYLNLWLRAGGVFPAYQEFWVGNCAAKFLFMRILLICKRN